MGYKGELEVECDNCGKLINEFENLYCEDCLNSQEESIGDFCCGVENCVHYKHELEECLKGCEVIFTGDFDDEGRPIFVCEGYRKQVKR